MVCCWLVFVTRQPPSLLPDTNGYSPVNHHITAGVYASTNGHQWPLNGSNSYAQTNGHYAAPPPLGVCSSYNAQTPSLCPALPNGISSACPTTLTGSGTLTNQVRLHHSSCATNLLLTFACPPTLTNTNKHLLVKHVVVRRKAFIY